MGPKMIAVSMGDERKWLGIMRIEPKSVSREFYTAVISDGNHSFEDNSLVMRRKD
jgi:hypothetical protein